MKTRKTRCAVTKICQSELTHMLQHISTLAHQVHIVVPTKNHFQNFAKKSNEHRKQCKCSIGYRFEFSEAKSVAISKVQGLRPCSLTSECHSSATFSKGILLNSSTEFMLAFFEQGFFTIFNFLVAGTIKLTQSSTFGMPGLIRFFFAFRYFTGQKNERSRQRRSQTAGS